MLPAEAGEIVGLKPTMREVVSESACRFHFARDAKNPAAQGSDEIFIGVTIHWKDGKTAVTAARMAGKLLGGDSSGFEKIEGVGDEAWMAPFSSYLAFSKGEIGVELDMRLVLPEKAKAIRLAKLIASRL
jgi:hypothetical protein